MYIIELTQDNGSTEFYGPFPTVTRAEQYGSALAQRNPSKWMIKPLVVPFQIQVKVIG